MVARRLPCVWSLPIAAMDFSNVAADEFNDRYDTEHGFETITRSRLYAGLCPAQRRRNLENQNTAIDIIWRTISAWRITSGG